MPRGSSPKRERQYEHIRDSARLRGESTKRAEEIAARTVNKERARSGEAKTASHSSIQGKQGAAVAPRERTGGDSPTTRAEFYEIARQRDLPGRSKMVRDELARKLGYQ
jgi:hypothetical protein